MALHGKRLPRQGEPTGTADDAVQRGKEFSDRAIQYLRRGHKDQARLEYDNAIAAYSEAIRIDPGHGLAYELRGRLHEIKGDDTQAEADLAQARRLERK